MFLHMLYIATCYLPYACLLFFTVLIFPALALFPALLRTPLLATATPLISILIVNIVALILFKFNLYNHTAVLMITIVFTATAVIRGCLYIRNNKLLWDNTDKSLLIMNVGVLLPLLSFSGISSFMSNDALASWNYWGLFYYQGKIPDTLGYPPFFSLFISYCYHVLGNIDYQGAVKALLVVFPFMIMNAIAFVSDRTKKNLFIYLILVSVCVFPGFLTWGFYRFYAVGYADPLLASAVVVSLMLLLKYLDNPQNKYFLLAALLCAMTASLSKQPGLLWACFSFPLLLIFKVIRTRKIAWEEAIALIAIYVPPLIWLLGPGSRFYDNQGVITTSMHQSHVSFAGVMNTLWYSVLKYLLLQPTLLILLVLTILACNRNAYKRLLFLSFILPGLILWFVFGSYDIRLGLYLLCSMGLLVASENYLLDASLMVLIRNKFNLLTIFTLNRLSYFFATVGAIGFVIFSFTDQINSHINKPYRIYPLNAGLSNIHHYFDDQAEFIYTHLYNNKNIKLWAADRIIAGIFYGHTPIVPAAYTVENVYKNFEEFKPDYVFAALCDRHSNDCKIIEEIKNAHPGMLSLIPISNAEYGNRLYRVNKTYFKNNLMPTQAVVSK